jgi:hypothetical protein
MDMDFWDTAFGGKDMLRLCIGARDFRIRLNQYSIHAKFRYGDGYQVGIWFKYVSMFDDPQTYYIRLDHNRVRLDQRWASEVGMVRRSVQEMTGYALDCFESWPGPMTLTASDIAVAIQTLYHSLEVGGNHGFMYSKEARTRVLNRLTAILELTNIEVTGYTADPVSVTDTPES